MTWDQIKKTIKSQENSSVIVMEKGEPSYLVKKITNPSDGDYRNDFEKANQDIEDWQMEKKSTQDVQESQKGDDVKVEDIPF